MKVMWTVPKIAVLLTRAQLKQPKKIIVYLLMRL